MILSDGCRTDLGRIGLRSLTSWFWALSLALILMFLFFVVLGAFDPTDAVPVTLLVAALAVLWIVHAWWASRRKAAGRDPELVKARERRGF